MGGDSVEMRGEVEEEGGLLVYDARMLTCHDMMLVQVPTTMPTSEPTTAVSTEVTAPTSEPWTAPTTEPPTSPTTMPTTVGDGSVEAIDGGEGVVSDVRMLTCRHDTCYAMT